MIKIQTQIIEMNSKLPLSERKKQVQHIRDARLVDETFYDRLTAEQRAHLAEGIAQADRGEGEEATVLLDRLAHRFCIVQAA